MGIVNGYTSWVRLAMIVVAFFMVSAPAGAQQPGEPKLSAGDSLRVGALWNSANHCPVYSTRRQRYLDSALAIMPHMAYFWQQKGMPLCKMKKYEIGMQYIDSAVKYDPKRWLDYRAFMKCIFQKSYRGAITDFEAARLMNGNAGVMDHPYDFYEGLCYLQLNMFDSAIHYLDKCIQYKTRDNGPEWVHPLDWFYTGISWYEKENYPEAIRCFDSSIARYPGFADAQYYKAVSYGRMADDEKSIAIANEGRINMLKEQTFNEDNNVYEDYPYQVDVKNFDRYLMYAANSNKKK